MSIKREDIDRRLIDIADVVSGRRLPACNHCKSPLEIISVPNFTARG
jgi:hypothetical protein